ncbi:FAD-binding and (Fe-S)-binding domain-containing protein [Oceanimonas sp. CHS3-5]|uniref:FAD-binding and (Fe-S)-binding domain-containing protein n=1 Tax=Oceanimonas sp. CHS3-5 TaxID=3068186 RepID=UPI00273E397C|nr:FAD-binding and (Fe-S)-binding domain-containing protein [Oceanimonas sp. CHS3-5]MDP5293431.1 FAD-binding and (Fe-S)-binding domain-containing protein [Oceanimonas sp. CHS3-5]
MEARYQRLADELAGFLPNERIITDTSLCLAYGTDASFYRLLPKLVLRLASTDEVIRVLAACRQHNIHCTFRAAGTSLSGQAVSDSVLITLTDDWRGHRIEDDGQRIALQPGVIGADANRYLVRYGRKIGPDPASINSCKIGGIAANNASGMCCGTAQNSYRTLHGLSLVLADGTQLDTRDAASRARFAEQKPELLAGLKQLSEEVKANAELSERIRHKYRLKNTTGYSLNALVDFDDPFDMLAHLMIGSEGTLGFMAEVSYHTVPDHPFKASCLLVYADIETTCRAVTALADTPVAAVELMDGRALASIAGKPGMPDFINELDTEAAALLVEVHGADETELLEKCERAMAAVTPFDRRNQVAFTQDKATCATLWAMRKGMFPAVGAMRETGTTVIIEDVAFPVEELAPAVRKLTALFERFGYHEAIIFGHALAGNLHFVFTQGFDAQSELDRYGGFMDAVAELVAVDYGGSLKAEHGTGRNMAPYVELEWGKDGYALMQRIKALFDPDGLLNPGVILNEDHQAHLKDLKPLPAADTIVDKCIECGFCEAVCPSRDLSLTPRQRIVLFRELSRRAAAGEQTADTLQTVFDKQGIDTCAATGLCAQRCPVGINTGDLVRQLRTARYQKFEPIARWTASHFTATTKAVALGLNAAHLGRKLLGEKSMTRLNARLRKVSNNRVPLWLPETPAANPHQPKAGGTGPDKVVYFPSCASRTLGAEPGAKDPRSLTEVTLAVLKKAGFEVILPESLSSLCCGMPYQSKGMMDLADNKATELEDALWQASEQGRWPVLMDTSPCAKRSLETSRRPLQVFEPVQFVLEQAQERLTLTPVNETVMLHITCSSRRMGLADAMLTLARRCADTVVVPEHIECCGFAGDKGFTTPELNAAALKPLRQQVPTGCTRGVSNSRTCELGLSHHSGINYESILYLVDEASH